MSRSYILNRRPAYSFSLAFGTQFEVSIGLLETDEPGEVFITGGKVGTQVEALARDSAILISLCLQHGCSLETIRKALTREFDDTPSSIAGALADAIEREHLALKNQP